jgi:hypothetical protein
MPMGMFLWLLSNAGGGVFLPSAPVVVIENRNNTRNIKKYCYCFHGCSSTNVKVILLVAEQVLRLIVPLK